MDDTHMEVPLDLVEYFGSFLKCASWKSGILREVTGLYVSFYVKCTAFLPNSGGYHHRVKYLTCHEPASYHRKTTHSARAERWLLLVACGFVLDCVAINGKTSALVMQ
eukprot:2599631-Amphidinium_carterae.1